MAYGARLESVLGASPRGFESPILRHRTPEPAQVPGFSLRLQRKVPIVGEGRCFNESRVFPLVMDLEGKNRGTKYEISTTRRGGRWGAFLLLLLVVPLVFRAPERTGELRDTEPGCGARGRRQGLAGLRGDAPSEARGADDSRAGRRPRAHQAARPHSKTLRALHTGGACRAVSTAARPCLRPRALQPGPAGPACHMRPQSTDARARLRSLRADRQPGAARLAGPRPRPLRPRDPRRSLRPGARRGPRPSRTASSGAGPSRCSSSRPRTPNR